MGIHDRDYYRDEEPGLRIDLRTQPVVVQLIVVNVAVFVVNLFTSTPQHPDWLMGALTNSPAYVPQPLEWWHSLSAGFAHANATHLLFNMLGLFVLGRDVERQMGRRAFLGVYLAAVLVSSWVFMLRHYFFTAPDSWPAVLGASGAVSAVVVLYACYFPKRQLLVMFVFPLPAWAVAALFVAVDMLAVDKQVAHDVHLAGAAFGGLCFLARQRIAGLSSGLPSLRRRPKLRVLSAESDEELEREGDRLLDKVHREGEESLTRKERKLLQRYSQHLRRRRENA